MPFGALQPSVGIRDWLLGEGARMPNAEEMLAGLAERLIAIGVPVDRASTAIDTLHSEYAGVGRIWLGRDGLLELIEALGFVQVDSISTVARTVPWGRPT